MRLALLGYGGVGRAFAKVVAERRHDLADRFEQEVDIVLIRRSTQQALLNAGDESSTLSWGPIEPLGAAIARLGIDVVVQAVPSDATMADTAHDQILEAIEAGAAVVTATKSPLVRHWAEIHRAATTAGQPVRISAAAGAALPAVDLSRRGLRGLPVRSLRASLNGTSNFVLEAMRAGAGFDQAVLDAIARGICEPNPTEDLSGHDAAMKLVILANLVWGRGHSLGDVQVQGIDADIEGTLNDARRQGAALRSIATASSDEKQALTVSIEVVDPGDHLARLPGAEKGVVFECGSCGTVVVTGGKSSPEGAAYAMLKDILNIATGDREAGLG